MEKEFEKAIERAKKDGRNEQTIFVMKRLYNGMEENNENISYWKSLYFNK